MDYEEPPTENPPPAQRLFTLKSANASLVLLRKVVGDLVTQYRELLEFRREREELAMLVDASDRLDELVRTIEQRVDSLKNLVSELESVGCELKDFSRGLIDFPAMRAGKLIYLCWMLGEDQIEYWHSLEGGFAGRQPIDDLIE